MCKAPYGHLMVNFSILIWLVVYPSEKYEFVSWDHYSQYPLVMTNIAMENGPFIDDFPIKTSTYKGFSMAMLNNQKVWKVIKFMFQTTQLWSTFPSGWRYPVLFAETEAPRNHPPSTRPEAPSPKISSTMYRPANVGLGGWCMVGKCA